MPKHILLFGSGKSSVFLIEYLMRECTLHDWLLSIADSNPGGFEPRLRDTGGASAIQLDVLDDDARKRLVSRSDLVISLLPPSLHYLVARDCLAFGKHLLTASYIDKQMAGFDKEAKEKGILLLFEMGLDPGIDHMSAIRLINELKAPGVNITSFRSHCGGLVAPESDDNPMHYKISWNPRNIVMAGSQGALFRQNGTNIEVKYEDLFIECGEIYIDGFGSLAFYPNRDSLAYMSMYGLEDVQTFMRTTLRHPAYCKAWNGIVKAGLTSDKQTLQHPLPTFREWSQPLLEFVNSATRKQFEFLGLFDDTQVPSMVNTSIDVLRFLMETKMMMKPGDKDMIVMVHEVDYTKGGTAHKKISSLILKGEDHVHTAMAKTVGLPLGIAASLILQKEIRLTGLHVPVLPEIYKPVLKLLEAEGITFTETSW